eukprot:scaffold44340_cov30-Tisochrysis_lutea.AAC.1
MTASSLSRRSRPPRSPSTTPLLRVAHERRHPREEGGRHPPRATRCVACSAAYLQGGDGVWCGGLRC